MARKVSCQSAITDYVVTRYYRAPEVVLTYAQYDKSVDMWSFGCILFELFEGKPLFKAKNMLKLLETFVEKLGTPDEGFISKLHKGKQKLLENLPRCKKKRIREQFSRKDIDPNLLDLLEKCLLFDNEKRISAKEAMKHKYFEEYFEEAHLKCDPTNIDFTFDEDEKKNTKEDLIEMIVEEVNQCNEKAGEQQYKLVEGELKTVKVQRQKKEKDSSKIKKD